MVDDEDNFIEYASRRICHQGQGLRHRAVALFIYNSGEDILLQKRKNELFNGLWDLAGATHPLHRGDVDESYLQSALRCSKDEWGVAWQLNQVLSFTYFASDGQYCENEYCVLFAAKHDDKLAPNPDHIYEFKWIVWADLQSELKREPERFTPWLKVAVDLITPRVLNGGDQIHQSLSRLTSLQDSSGKT